MAALSLLEHDKSFYATSPETQHNPPLVPSPLQVIDMLHSLSLSEPLQDPWGLFSLSSLPAGVKKQVLRKPPLACHFCRGRKIACVAADPTSGSACQ